MPSWTRLSLLLVAFLGLLAAGGALAQVPPADGDGDGVVDQLDACADTPTFDLVDDEGCSVCDCEGDADGNPWASRTDYLRCVISAVRVRRMTHAIDRTTARLVLRAARHSTCGSEHLVRCCILFPDGTGGLCRIMDELRCDEDMLHADDVVDLDAGSCLPNPCQ